MKRVWIVAVMVLSLAVGAYAQDYKGLKQLFTEKSYVEVVKQAPSLVPTLKGQEKIAAQLMYASALAEAGKTDDAIKAYEDVLKMPEATQQTKDGIQINIAGTLRNAKRFDEALIKYQSLTTLATPSARSRAKQGIATVLRLQKKYVEAVTAYETALKDDGASVNDKVICYLWIGRIYTDPRMINQPEKAKAPYKQVVLLIDNSRFLAEALQRTEVGAKELADTLKARQGKEVFDALIKLCYEKVFDENSKLSTYDTVYCLATMEKLLDETTYPAELSAIWTRINRLTGIVGVNRAEVESWLKKNK